MTGQTMDAGVRERIMAAPEAVLDDQDLMRALAEASSRAMGGNVVDLRGLAMERLEARLDRLEDTHRSVVAAAYDNVAGTALVHRAVLRLLEAHRFEAFLRDLGGDVAAILKVDTLRLVLEVAEADEAAIERLDSTLAVEAPGFVGRYLGTARARAVTLRPAPPEGVALHGARSIRSEACLLLDLGEGREGLLVMGSEDPGHFAPQQGTDLLAFLGAVVERALRRWLG